MRIDVPARVIRGGTHAAAGLSAAGRLGHRYRRTRSRWLWGAAAVPYAAGFIAVTASAHFATPARMGSTVASLPYWSFRDGTDTGPAASPTGRP
jgi:hypothetical protein